LEKRWETASQCFFTRFASIVKMDCNTSYCIHFRFVINIFRRSLMSIRNRLFHAFMLLILILGATLPVSAQLQPTRQQMAQQLRQQGVALLEQFNIPGKALDELLPFVASNDQAGLQGALTEYGLDQDQVQALLTQAQPLIEQGMTTGIIQEFVAGQALQQGESAGVPEDQIDEFMRAAGDPQEMENFLTGLGLDAEPVLQELQGLNDLGLNAAAFDYYIQTTVFLNLLEEAGASPDDLPAYMQAFESDGEALTGLLETAGVNIDEFWAAFDEGYVAEFAVLGFSEDELVAFQDAVFLDLVALSSDDPDALAALLESYGFSAEDIDAFVATAGDPEAMAALLEDSGFSAEEITNMNNDASGSDISGGETEGETEGDSSGG
jgi:hypothetical protein